MPAVIRRQPRNLAGGRLGRLGRRQGGRSRPGFRFASGKPETTPAEGGTLGTVLAEPAANFLHFCAEMSGNRDF